MRRGGTLHPPIPRAPATTLQAPFLPSKAQDQATEKVQDPLKKGRHLWEREER